MAAGVAPIVQGGVEINYPIEECSKSISLKFVRNLSIFGYGDDDEGMSNYDGNGDKINLF